LQYYFILGGKQANIIKTSGLLPLNAEKVLPSGALITTVFPNPLSGDLLQVQIVESQIGKPLKYEIFELSGRRIFSVEKISILKNLQLDITGLSRGMYMLKIRTENKLEAIRFIKQEVVLPAYFYKI
jgi:hypothetical protein